MATSEESWLSVERPDRSQGGQVQVQDWWASGEGSSQLHLGRGPAAAWRPASAAPEPASARVVTVPKRAWKSRAQAGPLALVVSAVLVLAGSLSPWATLTSAAVTLNATGTDAKITSANDFVSGWITLIASVFMLMLGGLMIFFRKPLWTSVAALVALGTCGYSVFALIHIARAIRGAQRVLGLIPSGHTLGSHLAVGYGVIMVVVASGAAAVSALAQSRTG